jgi:hypothetical protein
VFRDLGYPKYIGKDLDMVSMLGDDQGALALTKNPHLYKRSKYINVYYYYIWDLAKRGKLDVLYISIIDIAANRMTKPLSRVAFGRFKEQMGLVCDP